MQAHRPRWIDRYVKGVLNNFYTIIQLIKVQFLDAQDIQNNAYNILIVCMDISLIMRH